MNSKKLSRWVSVFILTTLLLTGCGPGQLFGPTMTPTPTITSTPTMTPTMTPTSSPTLTPTNTPIPTPTLSFEIPKPKEGKGIIVGRILRKGEPASYMEVQLCGEFDITVKYTPFGSPCYGEKYRVTTNGDGYYIFSKVQPGGYQAIIVLLPKYIVMAFYDRTRLDIVSVEAGQIKFIDTHDIGQ